MGKKRILWLFNNSQLRQFEIPLLIEMGYEIFCPKVFDCIEEGWESSISYEYDFTLSIPEEILNKLNQTDFFKEISCELKKLINQYFQIAIFDYYAVQFSMLINYFSGVLLFHPLRELENNTYSNLILSDLGIAYINKIRNMSNRFFFAQNTKYFKVMECDYFKNNSLDTFITVKEENRLASNKTSGKITFYCPNINTSQKQFNLYQTFTEDFKDYDYIVYGSQPIQVKDCKVIESNNEILRHECLENACAMFYYATEKSSLPMAQIEALQNNIPLLFMEGGVLDLLCPKTLPGKCKTIKEAKNKLNRILNNDTNFINILKNQKNILSEYDYNFCVDSWKKSFAIVESVFNKPLNTDNIVKKIAFILPSSIEKFILEYINCFINYIFEISYQQNKNIQIVLAYENDFNYKEEIKQYCINKDISTREFEWVEKSSEEIKTSLQFHGIIEKKLNCYHVLKDNINNFEDCDHWVFFNTNYPGNIYISKPYSIVIHNDDMQKYDFYQNFTQLFSKASSIFVTNVFAFENLYSRYGVKKNNIHLLPIIFNRYLESKNVSLKVFDSYFVFIFNSNNLENLNDIIENLTQYYIAGGKLKCIIINSCSYNNHQKYKNNKVNDKVNDNDLIDENLSENINDAIIKLKNTLNLEYKIIYYKKATEDLLFSLINNANFLLSCTNNNWGSIEALYAYQLKIPTLCNDTLLNKELNQIYELKMTFYSFESYNLFEQLIYMENNYSALKNELNGHLNDQNNCHVLKTLEEFLF